MIVIGLNELKTGLSQWLQMVAGGKKILVKRYNKPFVSIIAPMDASVHFGENLGTGTIEPAVSVDTKGRALKALLEDREE